MVQRFLPEFSNRVNIIQENLGLNLFQMNPIYPNYLYKLKNYIYIIFFNLIFIYIMK